MANPYHDEMGKFCNKKEMLSAIQKLRDENDIDGYFILRNEFDRIEDGSRVMTEKELVKIFKNPVDVDVDDNDDAPLMTITAEMRKVVSEVIAKKEAPALKSAMRKLKKDGKAYNQTTGIKGETSVKTKYGLLDRLKGQQGKNLFLVVGEQLQSKETKIALVGNKGYDALKIINGATIDFNSVESIRDNFKNILFIEIKSSSRKDLEKDFSNYFFSITENEIQLAHAFPQSFCFLLYSTESALPDVIESAPVFFRKLNNKMHPTISVLRSP